VIRFVFRLIRLAFFAVLGTAVVAKLVLKSTASEETEEIDLVNIFGGEHLVSSADPFFGGKITNLFGGTILDLRKATPAPTGIYIDVLVVFGGLSLVVPNGWRVVFDGTVFGGGFDDATRAATDPDAPILRLGGLVAAGGIRATTRALVEPVA
jgi:predicted membrane protein